MRAAVVGMVLLCLSQVANAKPAAVPKPKPPDSQIFSVPKLVKPQSDGAVDASYNAAWQAYELGVQTATEKLAAFMTGQFEEAAEKGDLELAEMWEGLINSLKQTGTVAMAKLPVGAVDAARKSYEESKAQLKVEYDTLVKKYTKQKNLTRARQLQDEIDNLLKPADNRPPEVPPPDSSVMELVSIPKGEFRMGEGNRANKVTLTKSFLLGKYEVTQGQFKKVMGTEPWVGQGDVQIGEDNAASYVDWNDATTFCQRLTDTDHKNGKLPAGESYHLPTEAEWEYACRAGTQTAWSFGNDEKQLGSYGWFAGNAQNVGQGYAHKVGMKKPNPVGLFDMHGNVREWCSDWYGSGLSGGTDPVGPGEGSNRVFRGGSGWLRPDYCRSADRGNDVPSLRFHDLGFRVARSQSAQ